MKPDTFKSEFKYEGYSKEEQYFYEQNLSLINNLKLLNQAKKMSPNELAIERWETEGGLLRKDR